MAIYRNVHVSFWEDNKVVDNFTPKDKLFMLYLLTNPHTNLSGCYEISIKQMVNELGYDARTVKELLNRLEKEHKVIMYSNETKEILIKNWCKYNWTKSPKIQKPIKDFIEKIKDKSFKKYMVSIGYRYGMDTTDSDADSDTDNKDNNILNNILDYYIKNINITPNSLELDKLKSWINKFKDPLEIIKYAIDICVLKKVPTMAFLEGVLRNWHNSKLDTYKDVLDHENSFKNNFKEEKETDEILDYDWLNDNSGDLGL